MRTAKSPLYLIFGMFLSLAAGLQAQVTTGVIQGQISDAQGGVIPAAVVTATHDGTGIKTVVPSNETGFYLFPRLAPGSYVLAIEASGFRRFVRENIELRVDTIVRIDARLEIGATTESVTVTAASPLLKTDRTDVSSTLTSKEARELPLMGRNITFLMNIIPGTIPQGRGEITTGDINLVTNGVQAGRNYQTLDGIDNHEGIGGAALMVTSLDTVQEVKITTNAFDAEYGQIGGASTMVTTRSGTNAYHGSLFEYHRNSLTSARNPFTEATRDVAPLRWNQFGGSIGGPVKRNKLFFFGSYEGLRVRQGNTALTTVPLPEFRQGDFGAWAGQFPIFDPATGNSSGEGRTQFPGNRIPLARFNSTAGKVLETMPQPNLPGFANNYSAGFSSRINNNQWVGRSDYHISDKSQLFARYSHDPKETFAPTPFGEPLQPAVISTNNSKSLAFNYIRTITPNFVVEGRFGFVRRYIRNAPSDFDRKISEEFGIPNVNTIPEMGGLMRLTVTGPVGNFDIGNQDTTWNHQTNFTYAGNFVWNRGSHTMKWGMELRDGYFSDFRYAKGAFTFRETPTASAGVPRSGISLASFILGSTSNLDWRRQVFGERLERQDRDGFYWQDQWRVSPKLTINYGLRYEIYSPIWTPYTGGGTQYDLIRERVKIANVGPISRSANIQWDRNNFAPRLGIAYRFRDKMVYRLGYGRTYTIGQWGESIGAFSNQWPSAPFKNLAADSPYLGLSNLSAGPPPIEPPPPFDPSGLMLQPADELMIGMREDNPVNYIDSWNATFQHEFAPNWAYELAHVGNNSVHNWQNLDHNGAPPGPGPLCARQPYCAKYGIRAPVLDRSHNSRANYFSFQARLEKRFSNGWGLGQAFTWGKAIDRSWGYVQQNWCRECSKSLADYDVSTVYRFWHIVELPFGQGKRFWGDAKGVTRTIVQGWQLTGIYSWRSGYAFTPVVGNQSRFNAFWFAAPVWRPDRIGSGKLDSPTQNGWFDLSAFRTPADYTFGTSGRNILRGPGEFVPDMDIAKSFAISESKSLKFRASMLNGFNIANLANPITAIDNPLAGRIFNVSTLMRRVEFGLHLYF